MEYRFVECDSCGKQNRVSSEKIAQGLRPKCGECGHPLSNVPSSPVVVTDKTFAELVERSTTPVLVDFWAPWCGPCHSLAPVIDEIAADLTGKIRVGKLNTDESPAIAARFQIRSIPTLIIFQNGREVDRLIGVQPKSQILGRLMNVLPS
jgi:thioredoxin 2